MYYYRKNCVFSTLSLKYWENTEFNISSLKLPKCKLVGPFFISNVIIGLCFVFFLSQITTIFVLLEEEKKISTFFEYFFKEAHILVQLYNLELIYFLTRFLNRNIFDFILFKRKWCVQVKLPHFWILSSTVWIVCLSDKSLHMGHSEVGM